MSYKLASLGMLSTVFLLALAGCDGDASPSDTSLPSALVIPGDTAGYLDIVLHAPGGNSCRWPSQNAMPSGAFDDVRITLVPSWQAVGTYTLSPAIASLNSTECKWAPASPCSSVGGSCMGGTLEIMAIDDSEITFNIAGLVNCHAEYPGWTYASGPLDGTYTASRCD